MTRHFTLLTMLRMTPNCLLRDFFQHLGHSLDVGWHGLKKRDPKPLHDAILGLPRQAQHEVEAGLSIVFELACTAGVNAIREAARKNGMLALPPGYPSSKDPYHQAIWTWLHHPDLFDRAVTRHQVDCLTGWRKRNGLPRVEPRTSDESLEEFASSLANFLRQEEGRGQRCTVEHFRREDDTDYYMAYPDDFVRTLAVHDKEGRLAPRSIRPTFELVFAYNRDDGTLELSAEMASDRKAKLEQIFARIVLRAELSSSRNGPPFHLNHLKDRYFVLDTDPADHVSVTISRLRLQAPSHSRVTFELMRNGRVRNIYEVVEQWLGSPSVCWDTIDVTAATLHFHFESSGGRRAGDVKVDLSAPDGCHIRSRQPDRIALVRKYLKLWRIADA
jgi:hypothetical protein